MDNKVFIGPMRVAVEAAEKGVVGDVLSLFRNPMNEGKVVVVVEGSDDEEVYAKVFNSTLSCIYVDGTCAKHYIILDALNAWYGSRLLAIKDADFDRLESVNHTYPNLLLTDTHDMEGLIIEASLSNLIGEDAQRCQGIDLTEIYSELESVSYLKWYSYHYGVGLNFSEVVLDLNMEDYFQSVVEHTNNEIAVTLADVAVFKSQHVGAPKEQLVNGHDIFERVYFRAKVFNKVNFPKRPFFRRLRKAYPEDEFVNTSLFCDIKRWEKTNGRTILAR